MDPKDTQPNLDNTPKVNDVMGPPPVGQDVKLPSSSPSAEPIVPLEPTTSDSLEPVAEPEDNTLVSAGGSPVLSVSEPEVSSGPSSEPIAPPEPTVDLSQPAAPLVAEPVTQEQPAAHTVHMEHKHSKKLIVMVALLVGLALAAAAVFIYLKSNETAQPDTNNQTSQQEDNGSQVDSTSDEIQATMNSLDDEADFAESELSDTTLGL